MKDILSEMGAVYSGSEINEWMEYHYKHDTPCKKHVINFLAAYGNFGIAYPSRLYRIEPTANYPKSSKANNNRDGDYMLFRVHRPQKDRWMDHLFDKRAVKPIRDDKNTFYL